MGILKGMLKENQEYYRKTEREIIKRISHLPRGSIKKRKINKQNYYYLQFRRGAKVIHKYLGKERPIKIQDDLKKRKQLEGELKKVKKSLNLLKRIKK